MFPSPWGHRPLYSQAVSPAYSIRPQVAGQRTLEYGQVVLSTDNLFARSRARSHIKHNPETNPIHQLDMIGSYVSDLGAIIKQYKLEQYKLEQSQKRHE